MRVLVVLLCAVISFSTAHASDSSDEKPIQHLKVSDLTSIEDARQVFVEKTAEIRSKKKLDAAALHDIHLITYTLEKSVEYFTHNLAGEKQELAEEIAEIVEEIHLSSENSRIEKTREYLQEYFELADEFIEEFSRHSDHS